MKGTKMYFNSSSYSSSNWLNGIPLWDNKDEEVGHGLKPSCQVNYDFLKIHNCIVTSSVVIEKKLFDSFGGFRNIPGAEDYDCWLGLLTRTDLIYINKPLFYYDGLHGDGKNY